ncbi:MAG: hypothetical protein Q9215_005907 [Flavoplaca cf. flavocitrina]
MVSTWCDSTTLCLENLAFASNLVELSYSGSEHSVIVSDEKPPMSTPSSTSNTISRTDYGMAMDKDTLTMVVRYKIDERLKTISAAAAAAVKPGWSKRQCDSVERHVHTGPKFPKPLHPGVSFKEPGKSEVKLLETTKLLPDLCFQSIHSRKRKTPAMHAKSKRLQIDPLSHNLAGHDPGMKATALASKADTSPSPYPPVSNFNEAVIADNMEAISNEDVSTLKGIDPLGYFSTVGKSTFQEVSKVQALPALTAIPEPQSNDASTPPTASSFTSPPTVSPSTLSPTLKATTTLATTAPSSTTIVTTHAEIKAATLETMTQMKNEILTEVKTLMEYKIKDMWLGSTMGVIADEAEGVEDTDCDRGEARRNVNGRSLLFRGFQAWRAESRFE